MKISTKLLGLFLVLNFLMPVEPLRASDNEDDYENLSCCRVLLAAACAPVLCFGSAIGHTDCGIRAVRSCCSHPHVRPCVIRCLKCCCNATEVPVSAVAVVRPTPIGAIVATAMVDRNLPIANSVSNMVVGEQNQI